MRVALRAAVLAVCAVGVLLGTLPGLAQPPVQSFAARIEQLSEPGGDFDTDNLISNEQSYLDVIPDLHRARVRGGAYVGVGPDQNFSYIAQIRPTVAFIIDIRRDNLLLHLLFKALFAAAQNRVEYLSLLTGRPIPEHSDTWHNAPIERIVAYIDQATSQPDTVHVLRRRLDEEIRGFGVSLSPEDLTTIERFHRTFIDAGLSLKFESRGRPPRRYYPTYRELLLTADRTGQHWSYLASERDFQFVRSLEAQDLIVPVVGDLSGSHALAAIGAMLADRGERLSAFYISNVETYLYGDKYSRFVGNVRRLPHDARSVIIRAIFRGAGSSSRVESVNQLLARNPQ